MRRLLSFLFFTFALAPGYLLGQLQSPFSSDIPGQGISYLTAGKNTLYLQNVFEQRKEVFSSIESSFRTSSIGLRYGTGQSTEINLVTKLNWTSSSLPKTRVQNLDPGFRINLIEESTGLIPALALQATTRVPTDSRELKLPFFIPRLGIALHYQLPGKLVFNLGIRVGLDEEQWAPTWRHLVNFGFPFSDRINCFMEYYGDWTYQGYQQYVHTGLSYQISPNFQVHLSLNGGYNQEVLSYSMLTGFAIRFPKKT